ncbi:hypothetical protein CDL12_16652 [Handroanthus impetiginosus]|uniref:Uncharacterized protein n=1 Tax=Handroanthus impetiginosus TaxID=429701 RepID=A0A2G9GZS0_9LAMI|nr:hypothetical protein CDL12_16652 [Handroanthus impetiginosus]
MAAALASGYLKLSSNFMNLKMVSVTHLPSSTPILSLSGLRHKRLKLQKSHNLIRQSNLPAFSRLRYIICNSSTQWEPAPVTYASEDEATLPKETPNIFKNISSSTETNEASETKLLMQFHYLRRPLWLLGPGLLLLTGVVPTLWLPISSIFVGPNIASLLVLTGLDCIFNLGASLFLLMADSTACPKNGTQGFHSKPPFVYQFWNIVANIIGFVIPLVVAFASHKGFLRPEVPFISLAVLLGPYFLLLSVQMITEVLTWHWQSPVWLVTPVVYEAYRLLQLMRGLKLGGELAAPSWMMHMVRGLVCGWVLVLGVQLMRVAWYAGFTARAYQQESM